MTRLALAILLCCVAACRNGNGNGNGNEDGNANANANGNGNANANANANGNADANGNANAIVPSRRLPGDTVAWRLIDHAAEAEVSGDLAAAWGALPDHPQRSLLPYARLPGDAAFRAVAMAFADSDVEDYATPRPPSYRPRPVRAYDAVWNRTRAVYLSRSALYVPAVATQRYRVKVPSSARFETEIGMLAPAKTSATFRITVDGQPLLAHTLDAAGSWRKETLSLAAFANREVTIELRVDGPAGVHGFFADPIVLARGGGAPGPNVLFILIDTLRADALPVMPRLAALAARGARFDQAITAATWTRPSMLAMYGGDLPSAVGQSAEEMIPEDAARRRFYRKAPPLLPRLLAARGWRSSAIGNNFFLLAYPAIGLDLGFPEVDDIRHPVLDTPAISRAAIRYLEENRDRSWLLHLHYDAPHWPYTPPKEYLRTIGAWRGDAALQKDPLWSRYLAEAAYADDHVGRVLDTLDRVGIADRTLVIVVGDHGEVFDPAHDHVVEALGQPTLHHHGWSAYDEVLRVPLILALPGTIRPSVRREQVRLYDLPRTIADYLGVDDGFPSRGRSLRPLIEGAEKGDRPAMAEGQNVRALREGGFLYLRRSDGRLLFGKRRATVVEELYDLAADPAQHTDLAPRAPEILTRMRERFLAEAPPPPPGDAPVYHIRIAPDSRPHRLAGTFRSDGRVAVRGATSGEVIPIDSHTVRLRIDGPGGADLTVDPPESPVELALTVDDLPLPAARILAGEFALPLIDGPLTGERLLRLDARRPPILGGRGAVLLWRDGGGAREGASQSPAATKNDEVTGMMQRWGYAQPTAKARAP
ncbi:MAG: hypothetical protein EXR72_25465 [Myxococcales bacterium]|nr:hypothetical protein [Myxococcales bacterium]